MLIPFGVFSAVSSAARTNYIATLINSVAIEQIFSNGVDAFKNSYSIGITDSPASGYGWLVKHDLLGNVVWQKNLRVNAGSTDTRSIVVDTSGNSFFVGQSKQFTGKIDTNGTSVWTRTLGDAANNYGYRVGIDSSGNVYSSGANYATAPQSGSNMLLAKYNSSGTLQWQRSIGDAGDNATTGHLFVDTSGNSYIIADNVATYNNPANLIKIDSTGAIVWQRYLSPISTYSAINAINVDTSGNVYFGGENSGNAIWGKLSSAGNIQWIYQIATSASGIRNIALDSSGNPTFVWQRFSSQPVIMKYNPSGTLIWQRNFSSVSTLAISYDAADNLVVSGTSGSNNLVTMRVPGDGSKTGTYVVGSETFNYTVASNSPSVSSVTTTTLSMTSVASSVTDVAGSTVLTNTTYTANILNF